LVKEAKELGRAGRSREMFGKLHVSASVGAELVVEPSDAGFGAYGVIDNELDKADDTGLAPAIPEVLVSTYGSKVAQDKAISTFDA
jgi:hypothetical protein